MQDHAGYERVAAAELGIARKTLYDELERYAAGGT
jgi:DNA-binding NtrC family response regulator